MTTEILLVPGFISIVEFVSLEKNWVTGSYCMFFMAMAVSTCFVSLLLFCMSISNCSISPVFGNLFSSLKSVILMAGSSLWRLFSNGINVLNSFEVLLDR